MSDKRTLKAAMVGLSLSHAGTVGPEQPSFMRQFHHLDGVEVTAFCEWRNTDFLKDAEKHFPAAARYDNLDDLLEKEDFDLACVCVSPSQVPETLRKLSEAGKHYFVDKPLSLSADELVPAVRAVNDNSLTTFLGYPYRFHPPAMDLRDLIDQGVLGRPLDIESRQFSVQVGGKFGKPAVSVRYTKDGHEVLSAARTPSEGGGILHFIGCHHLELLRYVMGSEVKSVQAMMGRPQGYMEEPLEEIAILAMEFENGAYGCLHHGYTKPVGTSRRGTTACSRSAARRAGPSGRRSAATGSRYTASPTSGRACPRRCSTTSGPRRRRRRGTAVAGPRATPCRPTPRSGICATTGGSSASSTTSGPASPDCST